MLWSKEDFEREVRRQLVELESIRKRIPELKEVHRKIDLLEESHRNMLRKLGEFFEVGSSGSRREADAPPPQSPPRRRKERRARGSAASRGEPSAIASIRALALRWKRPGLPPIQEKCASCGNVLISSILFGAEVVFEDEAWHHKACRKRGKRKSRPNAFN